MKVTVNVCGVCSKGSSFGGTTIFTCSRCKSIRYCSVACQRIDWPTHKAYCAPSITSIAAETSKVVNKMLADWSVLGLLNALAWHWGVFSGPRCHVQCIITADNDETYLRIARVEGRISIGEAASHDKYPDAHIDLLYKAKGDDKNLYRTAVSSDKETAKIAFDRRDVAMFQRINKNTVLGVAYPPPLMFNIDGETYTA